MDALNGASPSPGTTPITYFHRHPLKSQKLCALSVLSGESVLVRARREGRRVIRAAVVPFVAIVFALLLGVSIESIPFPALASDSLQLELGSQPSPWLNQADPALHRSTIDYTGSFLHDTITVKVSGGRGGTQIGPFTNLAFDDADRGRTLSVHLERVRAIGGQDLRDWPLRLYRLSMGPAGPGDEVIAFSEPPVREAVEVAADRVGSGLTWQVEPGNYLVFVPWTRPIVQIPPGSQPSTAEYTIVVE